MLKALVLLAVAAYATAQRELILPDPRACANRTYISYIIRYSGARHCLDPVASMILVFLLLLIICYRYRFDVYG